MWFKKLFAAFTQKERIAFMLAGAGAVISFCVVLGIVIAQATKWVPASGGQYIEGVVGQPEYVNPVLASSPTDEDLVRLVFQNLSNIADSISTSPDLRTWTVHLKDGLTWQDGQKLTADDVVFTVQSIQNKDASSPLFASWQNVQVNRMSELQVQFTLNAPYAFFGNSLQNLYILPKHLFADAPPGNWRFSDFNLRPIGSGPYRFVTYNQDADGFVSSYSLAAWDGNGSAHPLIGNFAFKFFNDENSLTQSFNAGQIDGFGGPTTQDLATLDRPYTLYGWRTSSYYAVFFNTSNNIALQDNTVREALSTAIDRNALIGNAFGLNGVSAGAAPGAVPDYGPIPPSTAFSSTVDAAPNASTGPSPSSSASSSLPAFSPAGTAATMLDNAGWTVSASTGYRAKVIHGTAVPLAITLTVPQIDPLLAVANYVKNAWQSIGVQVTITAASPSDIMANTIKNRDYEALLFGNALGASSDLYSFWHSSQRFYPGLNLAIYANNTVDSLITAARNTSSTSATVASLSKAQVDIENDHPAVFLYSPNYLFVADKTLQGVTTGSVLTDQADRFLSVDNWYMNTTRVLK